MKRNRTATPNTQIRQNTPSIPNAEIQINHCTNDAEQYRHCTITDSDGTVRYPCPMEIKTQDDLRNYGISWHDCRTLHFGDSEGIKVYFLPVESRELAEDQWRYLDTQHRRKYRNSRCWVPGRQKEWVRCPDSNICARCPFKDQKKPPFLSWDRLIASGYEPDAATPAEEQGINNLVCQEIYDMMDSVDIRIAKAVEMKLNGYKGIEIAAELGISSPRVSNLMTRAREIIENYKRNQ